MSICNEFQSQPYITICCMYNETLKGSSCCEILELKHTWSWCEKWVRVKPNLSPLMNLKLVVMTIVYTKFQSQPCLIEYCTNDEALEGSSCGELLESVQIYLIFMWKVVVGNQKCHHLGFKIQCKTVCRMKFCDSFGVLWVHVVHVLIPNSLYWSTH